ncbi:MAG: hypothetical protein DRJ40_10840 [Thermoprotei archaeon]|nr:MAG: hypothetical protein DRJ40_10840 [Thermoprotei archaeon]
MRYTIMFITLSGIVLIMTLSLLHYIPNFSQLYCSYCALKLRQLIDLTNQDAVIVLPFRTYINVSNGVLHVAFNGASCSVKLSRSCRDCVLYASIIAIRVLQNGTIVLEVIK